MTKTARTLLKRYKIINKIGKGGFGTTYLAADLALPNHPKCVVKHLSPQNSNPKVFQVAKKLFDREAESLYNLGEHDRIPNLYAHFAEEGEFYLVQEFIEGNDLSREIRTGYKLSETKTIEILQNVLEVLVFVHDNNMIHRDIKPSNIMRRKQDGKLVLIDFGTVKLPSIVDIDDRGETNVKTVAIGTPGYMSCEQSQGKPKPASDIYALGITAIRALSGLKPEDFSEDKNTGEIMWRDRVEVSNELGNYIDRMICFDYRQRYQNASEALSALQSLTNQNSLIRETILIDNTQIPPTAPINSNKSDRTSKKRKIIPAAIAVSVLTILGIAINKIYFGKALQTASNTVNFEKLAAYLQAKEWQKADRETDRLILEIANKNHTLDKKTIENLDCSALSKINKLWLEASEGRLGFTPQQEVYYIETGNIRGEYNASKYKEFGKEIKWNSFGEWKSYSKLTWKDQAPFGHLPSPGTKNDNPELMRISEHWQLLDRTADCGI